MPWQQGVKLDSKWSTDTSCNYCDVFPNSVEGFDTNLQLEYKNASLCFIITHQIFNNISFSLPSKSIPPDMAFSWQKTVLLNQNWDSGKYFENEMEIFYGIFHEGGSRVPSFFNFYCLKTSRITPWLSKSVLHLVWALWYVYIVVEVTLNRAECGSQRSEKPEMRMSILNQL